MNKILRFFGFLFLISVLFLLGCKGKAVQWHHLYAAEGDETVISEKITDDIIDDETISTQNELVETDDIEQPVVLEKTEVQTTVCVYICGAVVQPGVYELPEGSRIVQVIEAAGGLREDADTLLINQARIVEDGEQIRIYTKEEAMDMEVPKETRTDLADEGKVNINTASAEELMSLPGIGRAKADAIVSFREETGAFRSVEDIMKIAGIKEAVFSKIRDMITV